MSAWGTGIFDNDTAGDWAQDLAEHDDLAFVDATLSKVIAAGSEPLDSSMACEGLAACEVVAALQGKPGVSDAYTETIGEWVAKHKSLSASHLIGKALASIDRIVSAPSELMELWDEAGEGDEFRSVVAELRARLAQSSGGDADARADAKGKKWWRVW
jgi:hypothetical protein